MNCIQTVINLSTPGSPAGHSPKFGFSVHKFEPTKFEAGIICVVKLFVLGGETTGTCVIVFG